MPNPMPARLQAATCLKIPNSGYRAGWMVTRPGRAATSKTSAEAMRLRTGRRTPFSSSRRGCSDRRSGHTDSGGHAASEMGYARVGAINGPPELSRVCGAWMLGLGMSTSVWRRITQRTQLPKAVFFYRSTKSSNSNNKSRVFTLFNPIRYYTSIHPHIPM
jgi:hypothetical protein